MLHPHAWVRYSTAQLFGLVFSTFNPDELVAAFLSHDTAAEDKDSQSVSTGSKRSKGSATEVSKSHRTMTFLLKDTRQRLRDFTADFCTQLSSNLMEEEFASQVCDLIKWLICLFRTDIVFC